VSEIVTPEPGLYPGIPFDDYLSWDAASNSRLGKLLRSPAHLKAYLDEMEGDESDDSTSKRVGRGTHAAVLEPEIFGEVYVEAEDCEIALKSGGQCSYSGKYILEDGRFACGRHVKQFEDQLHESAVIISEDEAAQIEGAREAVLSHPYARELLQEAPGVNELSGIWIDHATGVRCKLRADRVLEEKGIVLDLKTTRDASYPEFEREVWKWGYHRQGAFYTSGLQVLGREVGHYVIVAVETSPPFGVIVYRMTEGVLDAGEEELMRLLRIWKRCHERDEWPGYERRVHDLSLPPWAWMRIEDRLELLDRRLN